MKNWPSFVFAVIALILSLVMFVVLFPVKGLLNGTTEKIKILEENTKDQDALLSEITEKISAFPDFSSYEKSITELGDRLAIIGDQSQQLSLKIKTFENLNTQIDMLSQAIHDSVKRVELLEKASIELQHLSGEKDAQISELNTKLNQLETISTEIPIIKDQLLSFNVDQRFVETAEKIENQKNIVQSQIEALKMELKENWQKNETERFAFIEKLNSLQENVEKQKQDLLSFQNNWKEELEKLRNENQTVLARLQDSLNTQQNFIQTQHAEIEQLKESLTQVTQQIATLESQFFQVQDLENKMVVFDKFTKDAEEKMNTMKTSVENEVKVIREQIENLSNSLQGMETSQQSYLEELTNLSSFIHSQLNNLDSKTNALESNLNQLEEAQKGIAAHSDQLEILVNGFNQSLEEAKNQIVDISRKFNEQFDQIKKEISVDQEETLKELKDQVEAIGVTLPDIESLKEIQLKINEFIENEKSLKENIEFIQNERAMLLNEIEGNEKNIALLQENLEKIRNQQSTSDETIATIEGKIQSLQNQKDELANRLIKTDEQLQLLESSMRNWENKWEVMNDLLEKNTDEVNQFIEEVKQEYQKVQIDISKKIDDEKLKTSLDTFSDSMNQVINRVATLEQFNQEINKKEIFSRVDAIEGKISAVEGRIDSIVQEYGISSPEVETLKEAVDDLKQEKIAIEERVNLLFDALDGQKYIEETQQSLQSMSQEENNLQVEITRLSREKSNIEEDLQVKQKELRRIDQELAVLKEEKQSAENIQKLEEEKKRIEKEVQNLTRDVENKLSQIEVLQKKIQELSAQLDESKKYTSYIILPWDNLWNIARRYYRDGTKWKKILEANSNIIDSPYNLKPYTEIKIPRISTLNEPKPKQ
ncbi:MAG: LysM peptidoglycan-binding domain-containing protein [Candidatus Atribacteria bacterium]|nr:LysM peptidoglycan-binding domain-containing protein [Candidatus Atribacteria bacterium]